MCACPSFALCTIPLMLWHPGPVPSPILQPLGANFANETSVKLFVDVETSHLNTLLVTSMPGPKRHCQICGSMKLYKSVGGMVCDQGHVIAVRFCLVHVPQSVTFICFRLQGYIREDNQMEETSRHDMRLRRLRKERKPKKKKSKPRSKGRAFRTCEAEAKLRELHSCLTSLRWNRG